MENKNFMTLTEDELYEVNGGASAEDYCFAGASIAFGILCAFLPPALGIATGSLVTVLPLAEPANPQPGDEVVAGGYHMTVTETGSYLCPVTYGIDLEKRKNKSSSSGSSSSSSSSSSNKSSGKSSK